MKYMTVVYEIQDSEAFALVMDSLRDKFLVGEKAKDYQVVAMGIGNEIDRVQLIKTAIKEVSDQYWLENCISEILSLSGDDFHQKGVDLIKEYSDDSI